MKNSEVHVGETYRVKVSGSMADVRIAAENPHGGWDGLNTRTNRKVRIKSAQRIRGKSPARPRKRTIVRSLEEVDAAAAAAPKKRIVTRDEYEADAPRKQEIAATVDAVENGDLPQGVTVPTGGKKSRKASKSAKAGKKRNTGEPAAKAGTKKRPSGLDAAAKVLADAGEPMKVKEMVSRMLNQGRWETTGKTPEATIYAAIIREIRTKGAESRFRKVDRGTFELNM